MKLCRIGEAGQERPALVDADGRLRDLSAHIADLDGAASGPEGRARLAAIDVDSLPVVEGPVRYGPPVTGTRLLLIGPEGVCRQAASIASSITSAHRMPIASSCCWAPPRRRRAKPHTR